RGAAAAGADGRAGREYVFPKALPVNPAAVAGMRGMNRRHRTRAPRRPPAPPFPELTRCARPPYTGHSSRKGGAMRYGGDEGAGVGFDTARGRDWPSVRQFNVFLENRLGGLMSVVRRFETSDNHIVSLTVVDSADCAIIRIVLSDPERALET